MTKIHRFFEENSFEFGDMHSPSLSPGNVLSMLRLGLKNYYESYSAFSESKIKGYTYQIYWGNDKSTTVVMPNKGCTHEFLGCFNLSICYTQLFFELYIVEILDNISTVITRKNFKKSDSFLNELRKEKSKDKYCTNQTISYSIILERFKSLFDNADNILDEFKVPNKFHFLKEHIETLEVLRDWRNKINHSGKHVLYYYSFEVLFINLIMPIINKIISIEDDTVYLNRNLYCGFNVIDELSKIKLPYDYLSLGKQDEQEMLLKKINHFKELGRASFSNPLYMGEWGSEALKNHLEAQNETKREIAEIEANIIHQPLNYYQRFTCPCCGTKTLMTFEYWTQTIDRATRPHKAKCILCSYEISSDIGEPKVFKIMDEAIFNLIE